MMEHFISGEATPVEMASLLVALQIKGASGSELAGFAATLRRSALPVDLREPELVDTCGTGGGSPSFNISTAAAFVAAAAGAKVAKHGNRGVTSKCGSADVLEAVGAKLELTPTQVEAVYRRTGICFLFAPAHHGALRHVGPVRRELGVRTVFNQLGPLINPAGAGRQVVGVYDGRLIQPMAEALVELGVEKAIVCHGQDGLDEISPCAPTQTAIVEAGEITRMVLIPEELGMQPLPPSSIVPCERVEDSVAMFRQAFAEHHSAAAWAVVPAAAATLWVAGVAADWKEGAALARGVLESGAALTKLEAFVEATQSV